MPTYSYRCDACGHTFEQVQRITEAATRECPSCHALQARRMITSANFILKGSGWYSDLYSGGSNKKGVETASSKPSTDASTTTPAAPSTAATPAASATAAAPASAPSAPASAPSSGGSSSST